MKKIWALFLLLSITTSSVNALMVDDSVDSSIRNTYKTDVIENVLLPKLPQAMPGNNLQSQQDTVFSQPQVLNKQPETPQYNRQYREISVKKGTKFKVRSQHTITDKTPRGTKLTFVSVYPETSRYVTIPSGTVFHGVVTDSHSSQLFGNGGLIEIKVDELVYKRSPFFIDANVSVANHRRVYFNNIKGKHCFLRNMGRISRPGSKFMGKMWNICGTLTDGPEILLTPLPLACGVVVYAVNIGLSPVLSIFSTGQSITVPSGSYFEIKLTQDAVIRDY